MSLPNGSAAGSTADVDQDGTDNNASVEQSSNNGDVDIVQDGASNSAVAKQEGDAWRAVPVQQMQWPWEASRRLPDMWTRIWRTPPAEASPEARDGSR